MKKQMMTALVLLANVLSTSAFATQVASVREAREMTSTSSLPALNLNLTAAESAELKAIPFRFFSSIEMKRRFQPAIANLVLDERLGAPLAFNPGKSAFEHRQAMFTYRKAACDKAIDLLQVRDARTNKALGPNEAFLDQMQGMSPRILRSSDGEAKLSASLEEKLVKKISSQLSTAAVSQNGETPEKVLGALTGVDAFGGEHFRLHFKNLKAEVSLPMMLSYMTKQDAGFVRVLECASRKLSSMMLDKKLHDKYFGMAPNRLAQTLRQKGGEALEANRLMNRLSVAQLRAVLDTLIQLDHAAIMTPAQFAQKDDSLIKVATGKTAADETAVAARLEFLQFLNRELGDFRDVKHSIELLRVSSAR